MADLMLFEARARRERRLQAQRRRWPTLRALGERLRHARIGVAHLKRAFLLTRSGLTDEEVTAIESGKCTSRESFLRYLDALELGELDRGLFALAAEVAFDRAGVPRG